MFQVNEIVIFTALSIVMASFNLAFAHKLG
jgi:hypothetical protein